MITLTIEELATITLKSGSHATREEGVCAMEAVAWLAGEPHSDAPECTSPVIAVFLRSWNDDLPTDEDRQRLLRPLLPLVIGTRADNATELWRSYMALDWLGRVPSPAWLRLASLDDHAEALIALDEITGPATMGKAVPALNTARAAASAAARAAAWDAASAAARAAASAAAWAAAWAAARAAASTAARAAASTASTASAAARAAASTARDAVLPTVAELQASAQGLVRRMAVPTRAS